MFCILWRIDADLWNMKRKRAPLVQVSRTNMFMQAIGRQISLTNSLWKEAVGLWSTVNAALRFIRVKECRANEQISFTLPLFLSPCLLHLASLPLHSMWSRMNNDQLLCHTQETFSPCSYVHPKLAHTHTHTLGPTLKVMWAYAQTPR